MFDPKDPFGSFKRMQESNRKARTDQLDQWNKDVEVVSDLVPGEYHCRLGEVQPCLIEAYFRHEAEKPAHLRKNYCYIVCRCSKCARNRL